MALLALFLPVVLLGALLGLERLENWTVSPRRPEPTSSKDVDLTDGAPRPSDADPAPRPALEPALEPVPATA